MKKICMNWVAWRHGRLTRLFSLIYVCSGRGRNILRRCWTSVFPLTCFASLNDSFPVTCFARLTSFRFHDMLPHAVKACDFDRISSHPRDWSSPSFKKRFSSSSGIWWKYHGVRKQSVVWIESCNAGCLKFWSQIWLDIRMIWGRLGKLERGSDQFFWMMQWNICCNRKLIKKEKESSWSSRLIGFHK